jgi:2-polyprenyl-6-methoxyphenol hydroxylase-like FAD-dependent oxidoreductase
MAIEDAAILANVLLHSRPVDASFRIFERRRIGRTTTIVNNSWKLGRIAQWENRFLIKLRNTLLRLTPPSVAEKQVKFLQEVNFQ